MFLNKKKVTVLLLSCAFFGVTNANAESIHPWTIEVAPYLWAINMNGRVQVGSLSAKVSENFSDMMKQFDGGGMLFIDANKNKWGLFFNGMYTSLGKKTSAGPFTIKSNNDFGIFSAGVSYEIFKKTFTNASEVGIEPYLGARYTINDSIVSIENTTLSASSNQQWVNPILGARVRYIISKAWLAVIAGDAGGTSSDDYSYNAMGLIGYKPQTMMKRTTFYLGYRYLYQNYVNGAAGLQHFVWDMKLFGPVLGCSMTF